LVFSVLSAVEIWRLLLETPEGEVDGTDLSLQPLPHIWRDRFYIDRSRPPGYLPF